MIENRIAASSCFRSQLHLQRKNILQPKQNPNKNHSLSAAHSSGSHKPFTNACVNYGHGIVAADGGVVHAPIAPKMARSLINGLCRLPSVFHAPLPPATTTSHSRSRCVENFAFKYGNFPPLTPPSASSCRSSPLPSSMCDRHLGLTEFSSHDPGHNPTAPRTGGQPFWGLAKGVLWLGSAVTPQCTHTLQGALYCCGDVSSQRIYTHTSRPFGTACAITPVVACSRSSVLLLFGHKCRFIIVYGHYVFAV